jgi:RimJ/RimL family protein N-acetyltransferase
LLGEKDIDIVVLVGGSNPHVKDLQHQIAENGRKVELLTNVSNVGELMARSDLAISAAGSTSWELCLLALPSLLIDVADNQTAVAKELQKRECAIHVGNRTVNPETIAQALHSLIESVDRRRLLAENARALVDGRGAARVVSILQRSGILQLRGVRDDDRRLIWEWANDPGVRSASFSSEPISWETHVGWFNAKLAEGHGTPPKSRMFIAEDEEGLAIGQIRFDRRPDEGWDVGVSLSRDSRGRGLASELIDSGVKELIKGRGSCSIHAYVKLDNVSSVKSFERAGFDRIGIEQIHGHEAVHLIYQTIEN